MTRERFVVGAAVIGLIVLTLVLFLSSVATVHTARINSRRQYITTRRTADVQGRSAQPGQSSLKCCWHRGTHRNDRLGNSARNSIFLDS